MMSTKKSLWRLLAVLLVSAMVAAACSSDSSDSSESSDGESAETNDADSSDGADEEGDESDTADGDENSDSAPVTALIKIGLIAQDEELLSFPEVRSVSQAFVDYFNAEQSSNIELVVCGAGDAPESHVACAQQFVNDDSIKLVVSGGFLGNSAAVSEVLVPEGMPFLSLGNDFIDYLTPGQFVFDPGLPGLAQVFFVFMSQTRGDVSTTLFIADDPAFEPFIPALQAIAAANGVDINEVVPLGFEPDLTGPVSAANTENDAWLFVLADGAQCSASAAAVETVGFENNLYANDLCMAEEVVASGEVDGWAGPIVSQAPTVDGGENVDFIKGVIEEYGDANAQTGGLAGWALAQMHIARDVLEAAGPDGTRADVLAEMNVYATDSIPGFPAVSCPGPSAWVGACNQSPLMVTVADGQLTSPDGFVLLDFAELDFLLEG